MSLIIKSKNQSERIKTQGSGSGSQITEAPWLV